MARTKVVRSEPVLADPRYCATLLRAPRLPAVQLPEDWFDHVQGPAFGNIKVAPTDHDLTRQHDKDPLGERIIIFGTIRDSNGTPIRGALLEIWQANAAGRYFYPIDPWGLPLDPNFSGAGRCLSDAEGRYRFITIRPAAYPSSNRPGKIFWRPAHIHFSIWGNGIAPRMITQMYFEGDPMLKNDPIFTAIPDEKVRERLVARFDEEHSIVDMENRVPPQHDAKYESPAAVASTESRTKSRNAAAYRWDIVIRGPNSTVLDAFQ